MIRLKTASLILWVALLIVLGGLAPALLQAGVPVQRSLLPNGLVLLFSEEHSLPFVTIQLLVDAGSRRDPAGEEGVSSLTVRGLLFGTSKRDAPALHEGLDATGTSLHADSNKDYCTLTLRVLKKNLDGGLDLLLEVLTQPTFPEDEVRRDVAKTLAAIQSAEDEPHVVAQKEFKRALYVKGPYRHPVEGTSESLPRLTRDHLLRFYRSHYHPNASILTCVGDLSAEEIRSKILPRFEKWPRGTPFLKPMVNQFFTSQTTVKINRSITQANILLGHAGVRRDNPDYYSLLVMNFILGGGGFSSRLMEEIRNKRGLAYSVGSFFDPGKEAGSFQISLQTKNASAREAIALSLEQMALLQKERVTEKELRVAKNYLIGSFPLRLDTQAKLTSFLGQAEYYGLGLAYPETYPSLIGSVTLEDVHRVARKYLHPKEHILVIVADLKEAGMD